MKVRVLEKYLFVMTRTISAMLRFYKNNFAKEGQRIFRDVVVVNLGGLCTSS